MKLLIWRNRYNGGEEHVLENINYIACGKTNRVAYRSLRIQGFIWFSSFVKDLMVTGSTKTAN